MPQPYSVPPDAWVVPHVVKITETVTQLAALSQATNDRLDTLTEDFEKFESTRKELSTLTDRVVRIESMIAEQIRKELSLQQKRERDEQARANEHRGYRNEAVKAGAAAIIGALITHGQDIYKWLITFHH